MIACLLLTALLQTDADDEKAAAHYTKAASLQKQRKWSDALTELDAAIKLAPRFAPAYDQRGSVYFMLGKIDESLRDYDHFLRLAPAEGPGHWRRGIVLYYAGKHAEGRKQFQQYQNVDNNDVENVVWCYLCQAKEESLDKARAGLMPVRFDRRVPMMQVFALFKGEAKPESVLQAVEEGKPTPNERLGRLFFAHLYLGLYFEAQGDLAKSAEHIKKAVDDCPVGHYMWEVARVHKQLRESKK